MQGDQELWSVAPRPQVWKAYVALFSKVMESAHACSYYLVRRYRSRTLHHILAVHLFLLVPVYIRVFLTRLQMI